MECPQHGTAQSPLSRFCVECGIQLSVKTSDTRPKQRELPHRGNSLVGYQEVFFVCDTSGMLHALDVCLDDVADPIACPDLLSNIAPSAAEGYLYLAGSQGLYGVDLVAWLQSRTVQATLLHPSQSLSSLSVSCGQVSAVVNAGGSNELVLWKDLCVTKQIPLRALCIDLHTFAPAVFPEFALVAQRSSEVVLVCGLRDCLVKQWRLGGVCFFSAPSQAGIACLVEVNGSKRIVEVTESGANVVVPSVPSDTTWMLCGTSGGLYLWGNGSSLTMRTSRGLSQSRESGNIGVPSVANGRAIFISQDAVSSEAISVSLSTGQIRSGGRIGDFGFTETACVGSKLVVGDCRQLKSISVEQQI